MCFRNIEGTYRIAEEPITCYKVMRLADYLGEPKVQSLIYHKFTYYSVGDIMKPSKCRSYDKGENSFAVNKIDTKCWENEFDAYVVHSYMATKRAIYMPDYCVLVRCEIPAGETYWINTENGEYASFSLVIKEIYNEKWSIGFKSYGWRASKIGLPITLDLSDIREIIKKENIIGGKLHGLEWYTIQKVKIF